MNAWPSQRVVAAALRGITAVSHTETGQAFRGYTSSCCPWVGWNTQAAFCTRCRTGARNPAAVELDPEKAIRATSPMVQAQHVLASLLYPFLRAHERCGAAAQEAANG
jgi:hypothetical protein